MTSEEGITKWGEQPPIELVEAATLILQTSAGLKYDEHGSETPIRFLNTLKEMTTPTPIKWKMFKNDGMDEMITMHNIPFSSLCNHHVVPFVGYAHIAYVPDQWVCGLSKLARVVQHFAHGLQIQERLTMQVAQYLQDQLQPRGVIVLMAAEHMCMTIRGVQAPGTYTDTVVPLGVFADHNRTAKAEFLTRVNGGKHK